MTYRGRPKGLPLHYEVGPSVGSGKDNAVYRLLETNDITLPAGWVAKINHEKAGLAPRDSDPRDTVWRGIQYKKHKYDILRHFLGNYIPESLFVMSQINDDNGKRQRYVELTLQREVPKYSLSDLGAEQRSNPQLHENLSILIRKMQHMYRVIGEANARSSHNINLDAKLDISGLSDAIRAERLDHGFTDEQITKIINTNESSNLLVDPQTMQLYCIDFDRGQWLEGMDDAKALVFEISAQYNDSTTRIIGNTALGSPVQ